MQNLRFLIEYDGTRYCGWQRQAADPTIQGTLENALRSILREEVVVTGAGRTDAGVHASGQVANCRTGSAMDPGQVLRGVNALLPDDIVVLESSEVPEAFHARFDAVARRYTYTLALLPTALDRHRVWSLRYRLDLGLLSETARVVVGTHDFTSFCRADSEVSSHTCTVRQALWEEIGRGRLRFTVTADRFLHGMVRALVGTMVDVGRGYSTVDEFHRMLCRKDRTAAGPAAPPSGLVLEEVFYV